MKPKWNLEELKETLEAGRSVGGERLVADYLDVLGEVGEVATVYYHLENPGELHDPASYDFTFDNTRSLKNNFDLLRESVQHFRSMEDRPASSAATR